MKLKPAQLVLLFVIAAVISAVVVTFLLGTDSEDKASEAPEFIDHGIPAPVSESRGAIAALDKNNQPIVLALAADMFDNSVRTSLLLIDAVSGNTEQYWYPKRDSSNGGSGAFALMLSGAGRFYTMFGTTFLEFDPDSRQWTAAVPVSEGRAVSFAEGPDGKIYAGLYPSCRLICFDPATQQIESLISLDDTQKYPWHLQVDSDGWVYAGIGPAKSDLIAYHPDSGELHRFGDKTTRGLGYGSVWRGKDGRLYGRPGNNAPWMRLSEGTGIPVNEPSERSVGRCIHWQKTAPEFGNGWILAQFSIPQCRMLIDEGNGTKREIQLHYQSQGAPVATLAAGPNETVHGSTMHPMHWFVLTDGELTDHGGIPQVGGGNFCAFTAVDNVMYGAAYNGGYLYSFDTSKPWNLPDASNPKLLETYGKGPNAEMNIVSRPRTLLHHGNHIIMGGFPGYGLVGGGLAFCDTTSGKSIRIKNDRIIPGHSTIALRALNATTLVGATSVQAPGGAKPIDTEARIYLFDTETMQKTFSTVPVAKATEIPAVEINDEGLVFGLTDSSILFVFDPVAHAVTAQYNLAEYGKPLRQSLLRDDNGRIIVLLSNTVLTIEPKTTKPEVLKQLTIPATAGSALNNERLYFASGSHLWSVKIK